MSDDSVGFWDWPGISVPKSSFIYPKLDDFEKAYLALKTASAHVPANLQAAFNAAYVAGRTIEANLDAGHTVASDDFNNFFDLASAFSSHLPASVGAPIAQAAAHGTAQPDDHVLQSPVHLPTLDEAEAAAKAAIAAAVPSWSTIALVGGVGLFAWWLLSGMGSSSSSRRARA